MKNNSKFDKGSVNSILIGIIAVIVIVAVAYFFYEKGKSAQISQITDNSQITNTQNTNSISSTTNLASTNNGVSLNQLENATYQVGDLVTMHGTENITLVNGSALNSTDGLSAELSSRDIIYGDLNNDGINDAVALLYTSKGGAKNGNEQYEIEMVLNENNSVKTFLCGPIGHDFDVSQYSIKNGLLIDSNQNDIYPVGSLREAYKFDGTKCISGDVDVTTGKANF